MNTAAREYKCEQRRIVGWWNCGCAECRAHAAANTIGSATLTQQQGGEQEADVGSPAGVDAFGFRCECECHRNPNMRHFSACCTLHVPALRSKQAAASEGDGCAMCSRWKALAESADLLRSVAEKRAARLEAHDNAVEAVAEVGNDGTVMWLSISPCKAGTKLYAQPRHPADGAT